MTLPEPPPARLLRYPGIDSLRGLAVLLVVCLHVAIRIPLRKTALGEVLPHRLLNAICYNGLEAVFVFFVISGFLITTHTLARHGRLADIDVRAFYARRFARIVPPLVVLVLALSLAHLAGVPHFTIDNPKQSLPGAIVSAFGLHLNWYEGQTGYLPGGWDVLWSLSVEECFYIGFPLVCLVVRSDLALGLLMAASALSLPGFRSLVVDNQIWHDKAYLPGMMAIATGVGTALLARHAPTPSPWASRGLQLAGGLAIASVLGWGDVLWEPLGEGTLLVLTFGAAAMIWGFHGARDATPWPGLGWLRAFGRLSYEIYLTHMFVVFAGIGLFRQAGLDLRHGWIVYPPVLALSWILGWAVSRWLSEPADRAIRSRLLSKAPEGLSGASQAAPNEG